VNDVITIVGLSLLAGLATGLGGLVAVSVKPGRTALGFGLGFTSGVMITLALFGLVVESWKSAGFLTATVAFALGALIMLALDSLLPHIHGKVKEAGVVGDKIKLYEMGLLITIGMTLHNIPEGVAVGAGYVHLPAFGIAIAIAIAAHNIPEGVAVALPIFASTGNRWKAFQYAVLSGLTEPVGALAAALFLTGFASLVSGALAFAGGVMFFITLDELVPAACSRGHEHYTPFGLVSGALFVFVLYGITGV
jgi:ZIP family zinc transporter